jgi:cation diffusion facilitator CzcD-associated flavoprotein CzcO
VPDDDLFAAISSGKASVETGEIDEFTETGIRLKNGKDIPADIVVTATGLVVELLGGARAIVDGKPVDFGRTFTYKGLMFSGLPNLASVFGYTNASWTLRADLVNQYVCRLINYMDQRGYASATPVNDDPSMTQEPFLDFSSGYVRRAIDRLPKQGKQPWRQPQNYATDLLNLRFGRLDDDVLQFSSKPQDAVSGADKAAA